jgi:hypothetical protein
MVLFVDLQVLGEVVDTLCQQRNLDLRRTGVVRVRSIFIYNSLRVVHEVLSYVSKFGGREPAWRMPKGMIARSRSISVPKYVRIQQSAFNKRTILASSCDNGFDFDLDQPLRVEQRGDDDHGCCWIGTAEQLLVGSANIVCM